MGQNGGMISSIVALLGIALAAHGAWVMLRNPKDWEKPRRNAYVGCVLVAAVGATIWVAGWETGVASVAGTLGVILTVLGCLGANFISRQKD
jgi:hypothetical protein